MFETVKNHEERIEQLEEADKKHDERLQLLEDRSIKLENTVMQENRETRQTMKEQTEKLFTLTEKALGMRSSTDKYEHDYKMMKWDKVSTILLKFGAGITVLLGSGTGIYMVFEHFFGK